MNYSRGLSSPRRQVREEELLLSGKLDPAREAVGSHEPWLLWQAAEEQDWKSSGEGLAKDGL